MAGWRSAAFIAAAVLAALLSDFVAVCEEPCSDGGDGERTCARRIALEENMLLQVQQQHTKDIARHVYVSHAVDNLTVAADLMKTFFFFDSHRKPVFF